MNRDEEMGRNAIDEPQTETTKTSTTPPTEPSPQELDRLAVGIAAATAQLREELVRVTAECDRLRDKMNDAMVRAEESEDARDKALAKIEAQDLEIGGLLADRDMARNERDELSTIGLNYMKQRDDIAQQLKDMQRLGHTEELHQRVEEAEHSAKERERVLAEWHDAMLTSLGGGGTTPEAARTMIISLQNKLASAQADAHQKLTGREEALLRAELEATIHECDLTRLSLKNLGHQRVIFDSLLRRLFLNLRQSGYGKTARVQAAAIEAAVLTLWESAGLLVNDDGK